MNVKLIGGPLHGKWYRVDDPGCLRIEVLFNGPIDTNIFPDGRFVEIDDRIERTIYRKTNVKYKGCPCFLNTETKKSRFLQRLWEEEQIRLYYEQKKFFTNHGFSGHICAVPQTT